MISAKEWKAYNDGVAEISDKTEQEVIRRLLAWNAANPGATVAETREYAKTVMEALVQSGSSLASSFAAKWYDYRAEQEHVKLDQAITAAVYSPKKTDAVARYQAKKLVAGSFEEFAKACGEYARNDSLRALNETIMTNAKRDRTKGVRFARVTTGRETCTFCIMLAGRGAVYHTRESAGEFNHFHRHCDCKVVPGFEDDPMAILVEGHDPWVAFRTWKRIESMVHYEDYLYDSPIASIKTEAETVDKLVFNAWREQKITHDYAGVFERFVKNYEHEGTIACQHGAKPEGKELQLVSWLSRKGHNVEFLVPSGKQGDYTPDIRLDGELWEIKRIETENPTKARARTSDALRQSDSVIVDLSVNKNAEAIEAAVIGMLEDPRARRIMVIRDGSARLYKK